MSFNVKNVLLDAGFNESVIVTEDSFKFDSKADIIGFFKN
jgi:hypothetical protein